MSSIESLLRLAGERDRPSADGMERARDAAYQSWQRTLTGSAPARRFDARRPWYYASAAAVAVLALAFAAMWVRDTPAPPVVVARVAALEGQVFDAVSASPITATRPLRSGDELRTGAGRVALTLGDALSLRVDRDSRLRFEAAGHVTLLEGAIYVDSGGLSAHASLLIDTPAGAVRHLGTQFQVRVRGATTRVQVREGRVVLAPVDRAAIDLGVGDRVDVVDGVPRLDHGQSASGAEWDWTAMTAPGFDIENRPLSEFLAWLAREHGWQLRVSERLDARIHDIRLHGSVEGLEVAAMLERVSLITGVPMAVRDGVLWVGP